MQATSHSLVSLIAAVGLTAIALAGCAPPAPYFQEELASSTHAIDDPEAPDTDRDGVPDKLDCDPGDSNLGLRYAEDDLATAKGVVEATTGFSKTAWEHVNGGWSQTIVRNEGDASWIKGANPEGDLVVDVTARVTKVSSGLDSLRQTFVIVGATVNGQGAPGAPATTPPPQAPPPQPTTNTTTTTTFDNEGGEQQSSDTDTSGTFSAVGCGIELVNGDPFASIVQLSGTVASIKTKVLKSADRNSVELGEPFDISVKSSAGTLTCTVKQRNSTTTIVALNVPAAKGGIGFYTRQSGARFEKARACKVNR
jgi:hypothetical protein